MKAAGSSETSRTTYLATQRHIPENRNPPWKNNIDSTIRRLRNTKCEILTKNTTNKYMNWLLGATVIRKSNNCVLVEENIENTRWE
jgi:hypothetical protein